MSHIISRLQTENKELRESVRAYRVSLQTKGARLVETKRRLRNAEKELEVLRARLT